MDAYDVAWHLGKKTSKQATNKLSKDARVPTLNVTILNGDMTELFGSSHTDEVLKTL